MAQVKPQITAPVAVDASATVARTLTAAEAHAARVDAALAQSVRFLAAMPASTVEARPQPYMPRRRLSTGEAILASCIEPEDVVVDVGGGSGRLGLMLALRCREVVNVEPLETRGVEFELAAAEAGITNVRLVRTDWMAAGGEEGDVTLASHVTYGIRDIVPFVEKLIAASRRRVMIVIYGINQAGVMVSLLREALGEEPQLGPYHESLLPVLWEMGLLPEVRLLGARPSEADVYQSREEAVEQTLRRFAISSQRGRDFVQSHFGEIFSVTPQGFRPRWSNEAPELLITWETSPTQTRSLNASGPHAEQTISADFNSAVPPSVARVEV